jgi:hypothetical protein
LVGRLERKGPLGRHRSRWEDNIKKEFQEVGWGGVHWIDMVHDRDRWQALLSAVVNLQVP